MGFAGGVPVGCGYQDCMTEEAQFPPELRLHPERPAPSRLPVWGSIIDDVWGLGQKQDEALFEGLFARYEKVCEQNNLHLASKKSLHGVLDGEVQGLAPRTCRVSKRTYLSQAPHKRGRLLLSGWGLLGTRRPAVKGQQRWVGKWQHAALG